MNTQPLKERLASMKKSYGEFRHRHWDLFDWREWMKALAVPLAVGAYVAGDQALFRSEKCGGYFTPAPFQSYPPVEDPVACVNRHLPPDQPVDAQAFAGKSRGTVVEELATARASRLAGPGNPAAARRMTAMVKELCE